MAKSVTLNPAGSEALINKARTANASIGKLGQALGTGKKEITPLNEYLANGLGDTAAQLKANGENTSYAFYMLNTAENSLREISKLLSQAKDIASSAGPLPLGKLNILQQSLKTKIDQIGVRVDSTTFDGNNLFIGEAKDIEIQVGLSVKNTINISIPDMKLENLFRTGLTSAMNRYVSSDINRTSAYTDEQQFKDAIAANVNFAAQGNITTKQLSNALVASRSDSESVDRAEKYSSLITPLLDTKLKAAFGAHINATVTADTIVTANAATGAIATAVQNSVIADLEGNSDKATIIKNAVSAAAIAEMSAQIDVLMAAPPADANAAAADINGAIGAINAISAGAGTAAAAAAAAAALVGGATIADVGNAAKAALVQGNPTNTAFGKAIKGVVGNLIKAEGATLNKSIQDHSLIAADATTADIATAVDTAIATGIENGDDQATIATAVNVAAADAATGVGALSVAIGNLAESMYKASISGMNINTASAVDLKTAFDQAGVKAEFQEILKDNQKLDLSTTANQALTKDILQSALEHTRILLSSILSQKENVSGNAESLFERVSQLEETVGGYTDIDYISGSQEFAQAVKEFKTIVNVIKANNMAVGNIERASEAILSA